MARRQPVMMPSSPSLTPPGQGLLYSTFLGGDGDDGASGVALDGAGNAYVTGVVQSSASFPGMRSLPNVIGIFVSKLDPQGALVYSFLHPYGTAAGIAVDAEGSAYVAGTVSSNAPANSATQTFGVPGDAQAVVFKVSPDGSKEIYETTLGGSSRADGLAVAVDRNGAAYLAGTTSSIDFPLVRPLQSSLGARPLWKSTDSGATWTPLEDSPFAYLQTLIVDPAAPNTLYAAARDGGIFKSVDGGVTWNQAGRGISTTPTQTLAIDPLHPQVLYAATITNLSAGPVYRTVDGGDNWILVDSAPGVVQQLAVDAQNSNIVYAVRTNGVARRTSDSGATWSAVPFPGNGILSLALDPRAGENIYAYSVPIFFQHPGVPSFLYRTANGGTDWVQIPSQAAASPGITVGGFTNPSTVYAGLSARSVDGGVTWLPLGPSPGGPDISAVAVDPVGTLYAAVYGHGMFASHDRAQTLDGHRFSHPSVDLLRDSQRYHRHRPRRRDGHHLRHRAECAKQRLRDQAQSGRAEHRLLHAAAGARLHGAGDDLRRAARRFLDAELDRFDHPGRSRQCGGRGRHPL